MGANSKLIKGGIQYLGGKLTGNRLRKFKGISRIIQGQVRKKLKLS